MTATSPAAEPLPHPTRRNRVWRTLQILMQVFFTIWLRYRARGMDRLPADGGGLVVINHQSFLDPMLVGLPLKRPISFLARDSLFRVPLIGWILRNTYVMPISRESASSATIKQAVARMKHGFLVGIFPEGTRSSSGEIGEFKPGFISLIRRSRLPVYPVGVAGADRAFPRRAWFLRPARVCVVFGEPLLPEEIEPLMQRGREQELVALTRQRVAACSREAEAWRRGITGPLLLDDELEDNSESRDSEQPVASE